MQCDGLDPNRNNYNGTYLETATDLADCKAKCVAGGFKSCAFKNNNACYGIDAYTGYCDKSHASEWTTYSTGVTGLSYSCAVDESTNGGGASKCSSDSHCKGARTCSSGDCTGSSGCGSIESIFLCDGGLRNTGQILFESIGTVIDLADC